MTCAEIQSDAAGLALLGDPSAAAHAAACPECARALADASRVVALVGGAAPESPSEAALVRAEGAVRAELRRDRSQITATVAVAVVAAAIVLVSGVLLGMARLHPGGQLWAQGAVALALAVAGGVTALRLGGRIVALAVLVSLLFALLAGAGASLAVRPNCVVAELVAAAVALAPTLWMLERRAWPVGAGFLAAVAASGALAGQAALNLLCPARAALPHLVVFHTGGVLLAAGLGVVLALLGGPARSSPKVV